MPAKSREKEKARIPEAQVYIILGDDEIAAGESIQTLRARYQSGGFTSMNSVQLNGGSVTRDELANHVNILPMGGGSRLVFVEQALDLVRSKDDAGWLEKLLGSMPESTILVMGVEDSQKYSRGRMVWQTVGPGHVLRKTLKNAGVVSAWIEHPKPTQREMPEWVMNTAEAMQVKIDGRAAAELARLVGTDLLQARNELIKAADYAGDGQPITRDIIQLLCSPSREEDIFALVDAAGQRDPRKALGLLNALLRDQPIPYVFSMVSRQIRLLIMVKEVMDEGGDKDTVIKETGLHPYVAGKLLNQAPRFSMDELEEIYCQLDRMDEFAKTGRGTLDVMLETLIAGLSK